jgi:hypothetical protein
MDKELERWSWDPGHKARNQWDEKNKETAINKVTVMYHQRREMDHFFTAPLYIDEPQ